MSKSEKRLSQIIAKLNAKSCDSLLDFAEFLLAKQLPEEGPSAVEQLEPCLETPPENESVIAAVKRLQRSYHMLDTNLLFNKTSSLVTSNLLGGRDAPEVIAELETTFAEAYQQYIEERQGFE